MYLWIIKHLILNLLCICLCGHFKFDKTYIIGTAVVANVMYVQHRTVHKIIMMN